MPSKVPVCVDVPSVGMGWYGREEGRNRRTDRGGGKGTEGEGSKKLNWQGRRRRCGEEGRGILVGGLGGDSDKEVAATWHRRVVVEGRGGGKRECMREREKTKRKKKKR